MDVHLGVPPSVGQCGGIHHKRSCAMQVSPVSSFPSNSSFGSGAGGSGFDNIVDLPRVVASKPDGDYSSDSVFLWFMSMIGFPSNMAPPYDRDVDSIGQGEDNILNEQEREILKAFIQLAELASADTGAAGSVFSAIDYSNLSVNLAKITIQSALKDIAYYRAAGVHVPHAPGSLINWNAAQIDWSLYDNGGSAEDVFLNFLQSELRK